MLGRDKVCAVVAAPDARSMAGQLRRALKKTRTVELRLDWLANDREIERFLGYLRAGKIAGRKRGLTLIATCRRREAGGRFAGTIAEELFYLSEAVRAGCVWYDLEIESVRTGITSVMPLLLDSGRQLTSAHFFKAMPRDVERIAAKLASAGGGANGHGAPGRRSRPNSAGGVKIAAHCDSLAEALRLLRLARTRRNVVAIPMGEVAAPARLLALREKNGFAYAPVEHATAPGQISLDEMTGTYRADKLSRATRVYGVIGEPIGHSLSPAMQNAGFQARKMDAVYVPFLVRDLQDFVRAIGPLGIRGFSVTLPHKEKILRYLDVCDPLAEKIGAVNTVVVRSGKLYGYNTDYVGVLQSLERRIPLRGSRVLIVGAGGVARAVALALAEAGAAVCVTARRPKQAASLARAVGGEAVPRSRVRKESFDAIVNATPVGMHPVANASPLDARELNCRLVFDTIYRPRETKLLRLAAGRGIETVSGVEMFVAQGTAQWKIWTGERAPVAAMRQAVVRALEAEEKGKRVQSKR